MGLEAVCTVRSGKWESAGRALLETDELLFRGEFRLKIPLAEIRDARAKGSELTVRWSEGRAVFEIGDSAAKWADRISNPRSRIDKLDVKPGKRVAVLGITDRSFLAELRARVPKFSTGRVAAGTDLVLFGASRESSLARLGKLRDTIAPNGAIWVIWPKGRADIHEDRVRGAALKTGLVDIKVMRFSETHGALKLVIPVANRPKTDRKTAARSGRLAVLVVAVLALSPSISRADDAAAPVTHRPWWLGFGWVQGDALGGLTGPDFTVQRESIDGKRACRIGLGLNQSFNRGNDTERDEFFAGPSIETTGGDVQGSQSRYALTVLRLSQPGASRPVGFYWGIGPLIEWTHRHDHQSLTHSEYQADTLVLSYTGTFEATQTAFRAGLAGAIGVRWRIVSKVDLTAEYDQALLYEWDHTTASLDYPGSYGYRFAREAETSGLAFHARTVRIGMLFNP